MLKSIFDIVAKGIVERWAKGSTIFRATIVIAVAILLFSAIRFGYFGSEMQRVSRVILPIEVPLIDSAGRPGHLLVRSEIAGFSGQWTELIQGDSCPTGSRIRLRIETTEPGWIAMFGLSAKGVYPILENGLDPIVVGVGDQVLATTELDTETGTEIFGVLYSDRPVDIEDVQRLRHEHSEVVDTVSAGRGGSSISIFKTLPNGTIGQTVYCRHIE